MVMRCGVLALQGDWEAHARVLDGLEVEVATVRSNGELDAVEGLVVPGGESTTMLHLMEAEELDKAIVGRVRQGMPVLGTCAGVIVLAKQVTPEQPCLGVLDVDVERNAYGRQVNSTVVTVALEDELGEPRETEGVFIRAPRITRTGPEVAVLGRRGGDPVLLRQGRIIAATYHPELSADTRVHEAFVAMAEGKDE
jgi:5'-phosphate synthase pdxT subunit